MKCFVTPVTGKARLLMAQLVSSIIENASVMESSVRYRLDSNLRCSALVKV